MHKLNLDPRFRVAASFATDVVEANAETYMNYAWEQIGDVLAANQKIRQLQLATETSAVWYNVHLTPLATSNMERSFALLSPVAGRVVASRTTIAFAQGKSPRSAGSDVSGDAARVATGRAADAAIAV